MDTCDIDINEVENERRNDTRRGNEKTKRTKNTKEKGEEGKRNKEITEKIKACQKKTKKDREKWGRKKLRVEKENVEIKYVS